MRHERKQSATFGVTTVRKFGIGDKARIAPPRIKRYYPAYLRTGRIVVIMAIEPATHGRHCRYWIRGTRRRAKERRVFLAQDLRRLTDSQLSGRTGNSPGGPLAKSQGLFAPGGGHAS